jgi:Protein of unknown function (DUF1757)
MSRFFPHSAYAEDQPLPHTILNSHVLHRGLQTGAFTGLLYGSAKATLQNRKSKTASPTALIAKQSIRASALRSAGYGAVIGTVLMIPGVMFHMSGREEIEWQDRSWRLLENQGQMEVDDWSLVGAAAGIAATAQSALRSNGATAKVLRVAGGTGVGSLVGVAGYMVWRYGINGGKWPEPERP